MAERGRYGLTIAPRSGWETRESGALPGMPRSPFYRRTVCPVRQRWTRSTAIREVVVFFVFFPYKCSSFFCCELQLVKASVIACWMVLAGRGALQRRRGLTPIYIYDERLQSASREPVARRLVARSGEIGVLSGALFRPFFPHSRAPHPHHGPPSNFRAHLACGRGGNDARRGRGVDDPAAAGAERHRAPRAPRADDVPGGASRAQPCGI
jgi:hypothetical protein